MNSEIQTIRIPGPGGLLAVHSLGPEHGTPVLFAHSILASSAMWARQIDLLAKQGFRAIGLDARGHGLSTFEANAACRMDDLVADTVAVMDSLGLEKAHYVGLSLGGMSGFGLGIDHPDRILSLVLCATRADWSTPQVWDERIEAARKEGMAALARPTLLRWFGQRFVDGNPDAVSRLSEMIGKTSFEGFCCCARAIQTLDYQARLATIDCPVTLLVGSNDVALVEPMREIGRQITGARYEVIPDAGHLPNIDQPDLFDAELVRHFSRL